MTYSEGDRVETTRIIVRRGTYVGPAFHPDPAQERIGPWCIVCWDKSYGDSLVRVDSIRPVDG